MDAPPSLSYYLPRRSRRSQTYAGLAIAKGNCTRATTRWPAIGQEFSPFLLKRAPTRGLLDVLFLGESECMMTTTQFRKQAKEMGLEVRKQRKLEVFDIISDGTKICTVTYAELYSVTSAHEILSEKLRPEYIHPLG